MNIHEALELIKEDITGITPSTKVIPAGDAQSSVVGYDDLLRQIVLQLRGRFVIRSNDQLYSFRVFQNAESDMVALSEPKEFTA
jgi:hypothetical protein